MKPLLLTLALAVTCLLAAACGPDDVTGPVATSTPDSRPRYQGLLIPTPTPHVQRQFGPLTDYAPASIEERIMRSDVIARVMLTSVQAKAKTLPSGPGVAPTYRPIQELRFRIVQGGYLKGSGGAEIVVEVLDPFGPTYLTEAKALSAAQAWVADRNTAWDDREAVLFLEQEKADTGPDGTAGTSYRFAKAIAYGTDYAVESLNPVWLPADTSATGQSSHETPTPPVFLSGPTPEAGSTTPSIALDALRSQIAAVAATLAKGAGIAGYEACLWRRIESERWHRAYQAVYGQPYVIPAIERQTPSGLPAGTTLKELDYSGYEYPKVWLSGTDAGRFQVVAPGGPGSSVLSFRTARPLSGGVYRFVHIWQFRHWAPCNYAPNPEQPWVVTVTAPSGTAHEAFFDPVAIGAGFGADGTNGVLKPKAFTVGGSSAALSSLTWQGGSVVLTLSPYAALTGQTLDVLAVDGALTLSLAASAATVDAAAGTLTWSVASQPWQAGDLLMLRLRSGAASPTATPTPTPSVTATPTFGPTPTPS